MPSALSKFLNVAELNTNSFPEAYVAEFNCFDEIAEVLETLIKVISKEEDTPMAILLLRTSAYFMNACRVVMAGASAEAFVFLRGAIEASLYANYVDGDNERWNVWINRSDEKSVEECRRLFTYSKTIKALEKKDAELFRITNLLYETAINFGAHPNQGAITGDLNISKVEGNTLINHHQLNLKTLSSQHARKSTIETGIACLCIFKLLRQERFEILGIDVVINKLKNTLPEIYNKQTLIKEA